MKIYIFADKQTEADKARKAVEAAGHEAVVVEGVIRLGMSDDEALATARHEKDTDPWYVRTGKFCFNKPEDILEYDRRKATNNINKALDECVSLKKQSEDVGILTEMKFRFGTNGYGFPSGLLVMSHAVANGVPCCICMDCGKDDSWGTIRNGYLRGLTRSDPVFSVQTSKQWHYAMFSLEARAHGLEWAHKLHKCGCKCKLGR